MGFFLEDETGVKDEINPSSIQSIETLRESPSVYADEDTDFPPRCRHGDVGISPGKGLYTRDHVNLPLPSNHLACGIDQDTFIIKLPAFLYQESSDHAN